MMINELPRDFSSIATTYFEDYDNSSSFAKDMEHNMKVLSGLDPVVTNQEVSDYINENNDQELLNGTEDALLQFSDRNSIELATQNMETLGVKKRVNPEISVYDYYTQNEIANKFTDDTYRINFTNTKEDPSLYSTKYMIGSGKVYDALNSLKPNIARLAMRYIGQPATSMALSSVGGLVGAGISDTVMSGWDAAILGGTIYNTQKKYIDRYHQLLGDSSLSLEQFTKRLDDFITDVNTNVAPEYQHEIYEGIIEGANPFADAGLGFTTLGIKTYARPFGFLARAAKRMVPLGSAGSNIKRMQMNSELKNKIEQSMSNKVDETVVDEEIATKAETIKPAEATEDEVNIVKGIMKNEKNDQDLLKNSNQDSAMFDMSVSQEDIEAHNTASTVAKMNEEPTTTLYEIIPESRRPKQNYYIDHGKGIGDLPMTSEEADKLIKKLQSNAVADYDINYTSKELPDYVAFSSASVKPWGPDDEGIIRPYLSKETARTGAGGMSYHYGVYGSTVAGNELSRNYYLTAVHQKKAESLGSLWSEDEILKKENFKDVENKVDNKKLFERIKRRFVYDLSNLDSLKEYNIKEINIGFDEDYVKDLEKYLAKRNGEDLIYDLESKRESIYQAFQDFYYEGASLEDLKDYAKKIAVLETIQALFRGGNEFPTSWLQTFTGKNPIKYPYKYLYDDINSEPYVLKVKPEDYKEIPLENQNKYKEVDEKFNKWKQNIKEAVKEKYPEEFGGINSSEIMSRDDWEVLLETYIKDVLNIKEDPEYWLRSELNKMGFSAWLHMHHDNTMNIVTINDKDFSEITKLENNPKAVEKYLQIGKNNGFVKVSAGDGVGYFVRELHGVEGSKPMIVENYKVIDKGDWK